PLSQGIAERDLRYASTALNEHPDKRDSTPQVVSVGSLTNRRLLQAVIFQNDLDQTRRPILIWGIICQSRDLELYTSTASAPSINHSLHWRHQHAVPLPDVSRMA
ncbi:MAG: hypothetical protein M1823_007071, partial [Watsoniomyces obsoletus]